MVDTVVLIASGSSHSAWDRESAKSRFDGVLNETANYIEKLVAIE
jgi:hypothetical protein